MRRISVVLSALLLLAVTGNLAGPAHALRAGPASEIRQAPPNLLQNPGFEGEFFAWSGINEIQVAHGWTPWWRQRTDADPTAYYYRPEYKHANGYIYPNRVHGGAAAQQWFTFYATHEAGMYQQVFNVTPGARYRFTIWAQVWSSVEDNADVSISPAHPRLQVGIDPTGNWNPWSGAVVWSGTYAYYDTWGQLTVEAVAQNDVITVFMRSQPEFPVKHNDTYWDDAVLVAVDGSGQPLPPTSPPGHTPAPTATSAGPPPPTPTCATPPADWTTYLVQRGDTLFGLARRHGSTLELVVAANCLASTTIHVGQALLLPPLPVTSTPAPATATPAPEVTGTPTVTPTVPPTATPQTPTLTAAPATPTPVPVALATATSLQPTVPPPFTPTSGPTALPPTPVPASGSTRPCGTIAVGAGIVALAGVFRFRRRDRRAQR